jgi:hypothetical protein
MEVVCKGVGGISIDVGGISFPRVCCSYWACSPAADEFAQRDGFVDFADMLAWFKATHELPFCGYLITWEAIRGEQ